MPADDDPVVEDVTNEVAAKAAEGKKSATTTLRKRTKAKAPVDDDDYDDVPPPTEDEELPAWVGMACCGGLIAIFVLLFGLVYYLSPEKDAFDKTTVIKFDNDAVLRTVVWPKPHGPKTVRGANGQETDWAIFFYKPYCPACRRVWPVFRALGNTVNSTSLRFGEVDCVKNRGVCNIVGAEKHPLIRIYKAVPTGKGDGWKREGAAEWQGLLIAYEIMQWFVDQQGHGVVQPDVQFPSSERLAEEMRALKATGKVTHESAMEKRPDDPAGYLKDAELALQYGLIDHVLAGKPAGDGTDEPELSGQRLTGLLQWVNLQSELFPREAVRTKLDALFNRLRKRQKWTESAYEKALRAVGFKTTPVDDSEWRWCTPPPSSGDETAVPVGGYTCGLWLLFHTTLANSDRLSAPDVLKQIRNWVGKFFGCSNCAAHFVDYYNNNGGAYTQGHIGSVTWLWKAHNAVSMRLRKDEEADGTEDRGGRPRALWPSLEACKTCYKEEARGNETMEGTGVYTTEENDAQWEQHNIFEYHQEIFCFESDTFVCSGFDDTSKDKDSRKRFQESTNTTKSKAKQPKK